MPKSVIPSVSFSEFFYGDKVKFAHQLYYAWHKTGFVAVKDYNAGLTRGEDIDLLRTKVDEAFLEFTKLPLDAKMKYHRPETGGQRGYTPNGVEQSGGDGFREYREHFMVGPKIPEGHPILQYQPFSYLPNQTVEEVPELVPLAERLLESLEDRDLHIFEALAWSFGLRSDYFSRRIACGDSSLRLHHYPPIEGEILGTKTVKGVKTLIVKNKDGTVLENVVRAGRHTDVDFSAALLGAEVKGLFIENRDGVPIEYTTEKGCIVYNAGDFAQYETGGIFPSSPHWVELTPETASQSRRSMVRFTHFRPRCDVKLIRGNIMTPEGYCKFGSNALKKYPDTYEGVLLTKRLYEIGYLTESVRDSMVDAVLNKLKPDEIMEKEIVKWEQNNGISKLSRY